MTIASVFGSVFQMATQLPSRVFSSSTLIAGMEMVNGMDGVESLELSDSEIQAELDAMEVSCGAGQTLEKLELYNI